MPIYEYECEKDGRFEIVSLTYGKPAYWLCPKCRSLLGASVPSLCSIRPDSYWSGKYDPATGQTFFSSSYRDRWMKDRNIAVVERGMETETRGLTAAERIDAVQAASDKELERIVADEVMKI